MTSTFSRRSLPTSASSPFQLQGQSSNISIFPILDPSQTRNIPVSDPRSPNLNSPSHLKPPVALPFNMSAQEEFNQLVNSNQSRFTSHPEDHDSDHDSDPHFSDDEPSSRLRSRQTADSSDEEADADMVSSRTANANYHIPNTVYEANTGPKGVIADAQAFERARKKSFRRTLLSAAGLDSNGPSFSSKSTRDDAPLAPADQSSASEDDDEARFLRKWRQSRMHELQGRNNRRPSPRGRRFGSVETVDAVGYLDAIEKVTSDTVVVVCIYDQEVCVQLVSGM